MSNTVITNYTDLNGPSTKADSSVVVIVNKDGSLSVDQNLLGTLMGTDGTQGAISVVRVGHEGKPDDATDSETEDDKVHHVTLSVDSYYDEPNSIIKYDSGAEMLQSLRIETRENSLVGFQNDHCYTPLTSPSQEFPKRNENMIPYEESVIEIMQTPPPPPPKSVSNSKKITILEQKIIPKGKKIVIHPSEPPVILKGNDVLNKPLPVTKKAKDIKTMEKLEGHSKSEDNVESSSSSTSSSGESMPDRDSDSDYKDTKDRMGSVRLRKTKLKPRILKGVQVTKISKLDTRTISRLKGNKNIVKKENKEKVAHQKSNIEHKAGDVDLESLLPANKISTVHEVTPKEIGKVVVKQTPKPIKKEKKTPAHVTALLSDMTSLFSTPDVIRRVSTENKIPIKETLPGDKKSVSTPKIEAKEDKMSDSKPDENIETVKIVTTPKSVIKPKEKATSQPEKITKPYDPIPQLDEASLAQILQDTRSAPPTTSKAQPSISPGNVLNTPGLAGPLSPTLDLLAGLQPEEEGLTEDLLMHVAQLVESSENLQEVIDKQVLGKVDSSVKTAAQLSFQQAHGSNLYTQTLSKTVQKNIPQRKDPIEIVRRDGRVIKLPPIEAPATRSSKRKSQVTDTPTATEVPTTPNAAQSPLQITTEPQVPVVSKQYVNKKLTNKMQESLLDNSVAEKNSAESQESWNSEDDPNRLWCICKQPHNNRFMICCDSCEDWFHGKCVNITKAMGQQMEEQGIEWRCPNCIKKSKATPKSSNKAQMPQKKSEMDLIANEMKTLPAKELSLKTNCIVCKKPARASSIYCSDSCILKHAQDSLGGNQNTNSKDESESGKSQDKQKSESRVIVYERKSGRLLAGPNAPTAENLKAWLQKNPTFEVVRPGTLSTTKPNTSKKKSLNEPNRIQTTLNFERIPRKSLEQMTPGKSAQADGKEKMAKSLPSPKEEIKTVPPQPKTPVTLKPHQIQLIETHKPSASNVKPVSEPRKIVRSISSRSQSTNEKSPVTSPPISRRKEVLENRIRMNSDESIRDNVKKSLQEQMAIRMGENEGSKFTEDEIKRFAVDTEAEMHDLFRDVGMKYKAKYRSLIFNIKDRKNLTLWEKICDKSITPKQLVRLSPEELASQELAQWRDKEAKYQLELIKKSELDLLAASKTYVLKTHKGEEVMETKESVSTELDPNVPVEDVVSVLNDTINEELPLEKTPSPVSKLHKFEKKRNSTRKREREGSSSRPSKKSKRDLEKKSRSSRRRKSGSRDKESKEVQRRSTRRSDKKSSRSRSPSRDRAKSDVKDKSDVDDRRSRPRSKSREKSTRRSKSRVNSRSSSKARDRSKSHERTRRRSQSRDTAKERRRSRSIRNSASVDEKFKQQRSRSQENTYDKSKNDSTDSDSIERPKSAMLKEVHPEYDPHEPMITSAFSEEDLRKSREDVYEGNYDNDLKDIGTEYDPSKSFPLSTGVTMPGSVYMDKQDHLSAEGESDQEPSSTVDNAAATVWNGCINMVDVARFYVAAHEVSGSAIDLEEDLTTELDIVGRINPDTVWDYIGKTKKASNKDIVILRLQAANDEEKMQYIALYSYLSSRNRLGVVKVSSTTTVKDFYIVPLPANTNLPPVLLPLEGPGIGEVKTHLLLGIVIRQRKKRLAPHIPKDVIPAKMARESQKRSYTPPMLNNKGTFTPPTSPKRRAPLPLPQYTSTTLSTTVKDKIAASLACADEDEAYSPDSSSSNGSISLPSQSTGSSNTLRSKMEELNRQIEEQKQQIFKMTQANNSAGEDEAYSPSRPMTPSPPPAVPLADIALPSNLQEILATIKQRSESTAGDGDVRSIPLP